MISYSYYKGYLLDDMQNYELTNSDIDLLDACIWLVDNSCSIRNTADNCNISRSTLHRHIHQKLRCISLELYQCVCRVLRHNQRNRR